MQEQFNVIVKDSEITVLKEVINRTDDMKTFTYTFSINEVPSALKVEVPISTIEQLADLHNINVENEIDNIALDEITKNINTIVPQS
jgi:hypothetical protein